MIQDSRWKQRFQNFHNAYEVFLRVSARYESTPDDEITQMALAQAFEFMVELSWKLLKEYLEQEGFAVKSPKEAIRQAYQSQILKGAEGELWMNALRMRNLTSHTYQKLALQELLAFIDHSFRDAAKNLYTYFESIT